MKNKTPLAISLLLGSVAMSSQIMAAERWYNNQQVKEGKNVFSQNCASCHGQNAESVPNWKEKNTLNQYPPPPLNGTAHAWHHDLPLLRKTIKEGGIKLGGQMPAFNEQLNAEQIDQALSYIQSLWSDDIYSKWAKRFKVAAQKTNATATASPIKDAEKSNITQYLSQRLPRQYLDSLEKTESSAVWQITLNDKYLYIVDDGKYAIIGDLIDLRDGRNITSISKQNAAKTVLDGISNNDTIIYPAKGKQKELLTVFTDTSCPYCRKLHKEVPQLQEAGISVRYLPYPRGGSKGPGYNTLKSVWCEKDRHKALDDAKNDLAIDLADGTCDQANVVDYGYQLGNDLGISGTPALFKSNGEKIEGYVPYKQLIKKVLGQS